jgi:O-antigen/teichoic acid export membrane protein
MAFWRGKGANPILLFGLSLLFSKALAFVTIPLTTGHLAPADYGRLELALSIIEAFGIVLTLGLADSLFRFTAEAEEGERRRIAGGLAGMALLLCLGIGALLQVGVVVLAPRLGLASVQRALAIGLFSASLSGLIELPLAFMRLRGQAGLFLLFTTARAALQVAVMAVTLNAGWGVEGLLAGNAAVDLCIASVLLISHIRVCGLRIDRAIVARAAGYNLPLIGGSLAMFVLGSCDRWFLAGVVSPATLGFYGLSVKLSLIAPLAIQPFGMWWYARRIAVLRQPGGIEASARGVSVGLVLLAAGVLAACVGAPLLLTILAPPVYRAALDYLPWLALCAALNEICSLVNVGAYAEHKGYRILAVNGAGAAVAFLLYALLTPHSGVWGAIEATLAGHATRLGLYLALGRRSAPIAYPWALAAELFVLVAGLVAGLRAAESVGFVAGVLVLGLGAFALLAWRVARRDAAPLFSGQPA